MLTILCLLAGAVCEIQKDNASARIPVIVVSASYPGANASVVADTVAAVLEQQINGVEGSVRIESDSTNDGNYVGRVYFSPRTDLKQALKFVENRVALANPILPDVVRLNKISIKTAMEPVRTGMAIALIDRGENGWDTLRDSGAAIAKRLKMAGAGKLTSFPVDEKQSFLLIDREKCAQLGVSAVDVANALRESVTKKPSEVRKIKVNGKTPLGDVADLKEVIGPSAIYRVNLHRALRITCPDAVANAKKLAEAELTAQRREKFELLDLTAR